MPDTAQDISMVSGDTLDITVSIRDADGNPIDLSGALLRWAASRGNPERFSSTPVLTKSSANGPSEIDLSDALNGIAVIHLHPADTDSLSGIYYHELQVNDAYGTSGVATVTTGTLTIARDLIV